MTLKTGKWPAIFLLELKKKIIEKRFKSESLVTREMQKFSGNVVHFEKYGKMPGSRRQIREICCYKLINEIKPFQIET